MQSFLDNYFPTAINNDKLAHALLFYGADVGAQYDLALEIARLLNCTGDRSENCQCLNCKWIRENKHPAVLTVSRVDNKPTSDTTKTVISVEQARMIKNSLSVSSDYHRVFIFCDRDKDDNICGLNWMNFQAETANALLKTFEEPPANTTFIFLTKDKSDLISTVVSRAQSFFVPSIKEENPDYSIVKEVIENYFELERNEVLDFYESILALAKENEPLEVLTQIQNYMSALLKSNPHLSAKLIKDMKSVEMAKKQFVLNINIQTILETLAFELIL